MDQSAKILVTGSQVMVGRAVVKRLKNLGHALICPTRAELDLRDQQQVFAYFANQKPDCIFHLAAIVGGIHANHAYPAKFIYDNTQIHCNVIHAAHQQGAAKLLFPGSACTYPRLAPQPMKEAAFLDGLIEPTNIAYAAAKINGIIMCQSYAREHQFNAIVPMPTNAYGVGDHFDPKASHVVPALMQRFHEAKAHKINEVTIWGSGKPLREFINVEDLADALIFLMEHYDSHDIINVGTMQEIAIADLAHTIAQVVGYQGKINFDTSKPDGAPRKCLDSSKLFALGWKPKIPLQKGLAAMYAHHFRE
jgi:GDP-L-fucose synthase